jgi:hypothetical protein
MNGQINHDFLAGLFAQIERAWLDRGDRKIVYQLSQEHPELRDELYEFFEDLVLGPGAVPSPEIYDSEERVHQWLQSSGLQIATTAATAHARSNERTGPAVSQQRVQPATGPGSDTKESASSSPEARSDTWLAFLRRRTNLKLADLSATLENVTTEYLALISRHPNVVPVQVRKKIAKDVEARLAIPCEESLSYLIAQPRVLRAASRPRPHEKEPTTFDELLDRAALTEDQRRYWLQCAR